MMKGKKAAIKMVSEWVEYVCLIVLFIGFFLAASPASASISYIIVFLSGLLTGRLIFKNRKGFVQKDFTIAGVFLIGYLMGSYFSFGSRVVIVIVFIISNILSYFLHKKGWMEL